MSDKPRQNRSDESSLGKEPRSPGSVGGGSKTALIVGASSGLGRAIAHDSAAQGINLLLIARDTIDLEAVANDCSVRHGVRAAAKSVDLSRDDFSSRELCDWIAAETRSVNYVFLVAGANSEDDRGSPSDEIIQSMATVNFLSLSKIMSMAAECSGSWGLRSIVVCSSIAGRVPRGRNIAYASAKSVLATFALGLRHFLGRQGVQVQVYYLGYLDTSLAFGQKLLFPKVSPQAAARVMVRDAEKRLGERFLPAYWRWIVLALRLLPWAIYKRLSF